MSNQEYINRVIQVCTENGDIVCGDDGFYIYWPTKQTGALTQVDLRIIADHLESLNKGWEETINNYFNNLNTQENDHDISFE